MTDIDLGAPRGARAVVTRARKPAIGSAAVVVHVWIVYLLTRLGLALEALVSGTTDPVTFPTFSAVTFAVWGFAAVPVSFSASLMRSLGDRSAWVLATVLPLASLVLVLPISMAWRAQNGHVPDPVSLTVGTAVLSFLVLRWRLTGARLPLRAPLAVVASAATALSLAFATVVVEVYVFDWRAAERVDSLTLGVLDNDDWEIQSVHAVRAQLDDTAHSGIEVRYHDPETGGSLSVSSFPEEYWKRYEDLADCVFDCERRGSLVVETLIDQIRVIVETEGHMFAFERDSLVGTTDSVLIGLADKVRPATPAEEEDIRRGLVENYVGNRRLPPPAPPP